MSELMEFSMDSRLAVLLPPPPMPSPSELPAAACPRRLPGVADVADVANEAMLESTPSSALVEPAVDPAGAADAPPAAAPVMMALVVVM